MCTLKAEPLPPSTLIFPFQCHYACSLSYLILWNLWLSDDKAKMHFHPSIFNVHVVVLQVRFNFNAEQPISHAIWQRLISHVGLQWYMPLI
jgi:hypothetical protein